MMREEFSESEASLIFQGLLLLLAEKRRAFKQVAGGIVRDGGILAVFEEREFGIPQIANLIAKIDGATVWDEPESEVEA